MSLSACSGLRVCRLFVLGVLAFGVVATPLPVLAGQPESISPEALQAAIDQLGDFDYRSRTSAARIVRRASPAAAVPALEHAVFQHEDGYVRFRALVLLTGFNDPRSREAILRAMNDPNDRLRDVSYAYLEHHPERSMVPQLLRALEREQSEFVRPALVRALAALGADPRVREVLGREVDRGEDFFRSTVIEALGDYRRQHAMTALIRIARVNGPLQRDAVVALGKIGDNRALETLAALQRSAPRETQPAIAAAICLLGVNCAAHVGYLADTLRFAANQEGFQPLLRGACAGFAALAAMGHAEAFDVLFETGRAAHNPARAPIALAIGTAALRDPTLLLTALGRQSDVDAALTLLGEAIDMLEEDFEEERLYATARRAYWQSAEGSAERNVAEALIRKLEF